MSDPQSPPPSKAISQKDLPSYYNLRTTPYHSNTQDEIPHLKKTKKKISNPRILIHVPPDQKELYTLEKLSEERFNTTDSHHRGYQITMRVVENLSPTAITPNPCFSETHERIAYIGEQISRLGSIKHALRNFIIQLQQHITPPVYTYAGSDDTLPISPTISKKALPQLPNQQRLTDAYSKLFDEIEASYEEFQNLTLFNTLDDDNNDEHPDAITLDTHMHNMLPFYDFSKILIFKEYQTNLNRQKFIETCSNTLDNLIALEKELVSKKLKLEKLWLEK